MHFSQLGSRGQKLAALLPTAGARFMRRRSHLLLAGAALALGFAVIQPSSASEDASEPQPTANVDLQLDALAPTALGHPSVLALPRLPVRDADYLGGTVATGRVAGIYIKLAQGVFLSIDEAPSALRNKAERWVDVQFPEGPGNGIAEAAAFLDSGYAPVGIGDAVEIRFAHPQRTRLFPVAETTRVTALIARNHEPLARELERRILAQHDAGIEAPFSIRPAELPTWLSPAPALRKVVDTQH